MAITLRIAGNFLSAATQYVGEVDDGGLLARARRGEAEAFSRLFARHQGPIFRYAAHMCGRDAADDVVQETFMAVLGSTARYDPARGPVINYLFGIARHAVMKRLRCREIAGSDEQIDDCLNMEAQDRPSVLDSLTRAETIARVRAAIGALPPALREVVVLCELQEMSYAATAGIIGCPVGTVRSRLHRARALLAARLAPDPCLAEVRR
jgi:RNA polymerase sigma-70 factor (ECF subfamily)